MMIPGRAIPLYDDGDNITNVDEEHAILHMSVEDFEMCMLGEYPYSYFPSLLTLNSQLSLEQSNVKQVQENPNFGLFGQGVIIGMIDTGIDYQHEAFIRQDRTTKIISIWDQTITDESGPVGYGFGAEYQRGKINVALRSDNPLLLVPSRDEIGHGTMLAGIAAGNLSEGAGFQGVAPKAELIVVKLKQAKRYNRQIWGVSEDVICYQESDLILGINYVVKMAMQLKKPLVLCVGLGTSQGSHDSQGIMSNYLDALAQSENIGVVIAGGNEGNKRRHFYGQIENNVDYKDFELNVGASDKMFTMEVWQNSPQRIAIEITSPTGENIERVSPTLSGCREFDLVFEGTTIWVNNILLEETTGDQVIVIRFGNAQSGNWKFRIINLDGMYSAFNVWLPSGDIISRETYLVDSSAYVTLTSPGNCHYAMVSTAYNQNEDSILLEASRGYTRTNTVKPDFAAPGYALTCPLPGGGYGTGTGTGVATAHTVGIVAMIMEWAVYRGYATTITSRDINRLLVRGAGRKEELTYPNPVWGYGVVDVLGAFQSLQ